MIETASLVVALSLERFGRYLTWAADDQAKALEFYALNTRLSEALYVPLQVLEVALRNRVNTVLAGVHDSHWFEVTGLLQVPNQAMQVTDAIDDLRRQGKDPLPGQVVAALTFSFWTAMLGKPYENLWQTDLHRIARREDGKGLQRKDFARSLTPIRLLRNRIAHHEPILEWDLPKHHEAMLRLTRWLSPAAADWCRGLDRFNTVYPVKPLVLAGGERHHQR